MTTRKKWFRLDNAALIFPAVMGRKWSNAFRMCATLSEPVDPEILVKAAEDLRPRFPTFFVRLKTGAFWYYLEEFPGPVSVRQDYAYPLTFMNRREISKSCIRILYYQERIAVEFFHSVTDGTGGEVFMRNLVARYLELKYGIAIEKSGNLVDLSEPPKEEELRDSFQFHSSGYPETRKEAVTFRLRGTPERDNYRNLITGVLPTEKLLAVAHSYGVTVSAFLAAVMAEALIGQQRSFVPERRERPVKVTIPVNLRKLYHENTFRNFVLTVEVGVDPKQGEYSFEELLSQMSHQIQSEAVPQKMAGKIAANVEPQQIFLVRIMPLFIKNLILRMVYRNSGECHGCINISNLGQTSLPENAMPYIRRFEFIVGLQRSYPNNCSVLSFGGNTYVNIIRNIRETGLEQRFFSRLVELGVPVEIESTERGR